MGAVGDAIGVALLAAHSAHVSRERSVAVWRARRGAAARRLRTRWARSARSEGRCSNGGADRGVWRALRATWRMAATGAPGLRLASAASARERFGRCSRGGGARREIARLAPALGVETSTGVAVKWDCKGSEGGGRQRGGAGRR
eukprot:364378-Chlamydomonas_euryale.AAC.10